MSLFAQSERLSLVAGGPVAWQTLTFWHNSVAKLSVAFYNLAQDELLVEDDFVDVTSFRFELYSENSSRGELLLEKTLDDSEVEPATLAEWLAGTASHLTFVFLSPELNLTFQGEVGTFHYALYANTTEGKVVVASGPFLCRRNLSAYEIAPESSALVDELGNPIVDPDGNPIVSP